MFAEADHHKLIVFLLRSLRCSAANREATGALPCNFVFCSLLGRTDHSNLHHSLQFNRTDRHSISTHRSTSIWPPRSGKKNDNSTNTYFDLRQRLFTVRRHLNVFSSSDCTPYPFVTYLDILSPRAQIYTTLFLNVDQLTIPGQNTNDR